MENYQTNVSLHHIFREGNQYADFFAKLKAPLDADFSSKKRSRSF
jgi:hypothetical protein